MRKLFQKAFIIFILAFVFLVTKNIIVFAVDAPSFATCPNPNGSLIASYPTGTHGIVGDYSTHTGSDAVYATSETTVTQCFCAENGVDGIQTNWWNAAGLTQDEIKDLEKDGWILVPNGADWGLTNDPYLAKNMIYACGSGQGGGNTTDVCPNIDGIQTSLPNDYHFDNAGQKCLQWELGGANTSFDPGKSTGTGGQVLGANTTVLADTGSAQVLSRAMLAIFVILGVFFILII